jgi:hypothetical protein
MKKSFKSGNFTLKRKVALMHFSKFFFGWLAYSGYGVARNSAYSVKQGGRDLEAMHIHYFFDVASKKTVVQYKYCERDDIPYIPAKPIAVRSPMMFVRSNWEFQVFTDMAEAVVANISRRDGDGGLRPEVMPMKPWPKEERDRILKGILKLSYLNDDHKSEWMSWFQQISEVRLSSILISFTIRQNVESVPENLKFQWVIPLLLRRKTEAQEQLLRLRNQVREETEPQQYKYPDEVWITRDHTRGDRDRERRQRAQNHEREQDALKRKQQTERFLNNSQDSFRKQVQKRKITSSNPKRKSRNKPNQSSPPSDASEVESEEPEDMGHGSDSEDDISDEDHSDEVSHYCIACRFSVV